MHNSVAAQALKIACVQVVPGEELQVKSDLETACKRVGIEKYILLKAFGTFDIILLYFIRDLGFHLSTAGPISNILKSNLFLCYFYRSSNINKVFDLLSEKLFTGFSLLKINPALQNYYPGIENSLRAFMSTGNPWTVLGSFGWNEIILLISHNEIDQLCRILFSTGGMVFTDREKHLPVLMKTHSFIGMNYKIISPVLKIRATFKQIETQMNRMPSLGKANILIEGEPSPFLEIATKPMSMNNQSNVMLSIGDLKR